MDNQLIIIERRSIPGQTLYTSLSIGHEFARVHLSQTTDEALRKVSPYCRTVFLTVIGDYHHGLSSVRRIRSFLPDVPIVLLQEYLTHACGLIVKQESVQGVWTYGDSIEELKEGLLNALYLRKSISPVASHLLEHGDGKLGISDETSKHPLYNLTPRELEALQLFGKGAVIEECAEKMRIAPKTVDNLKTRLMNRLDIHRTVDLTIFAMQNGLIAK